MDVTLQLLNTNDAASVLAGLQCLLSICRTYRFKAGESRADLDKIVTVAFPALLNLGNKLVDEDSAEAGEMLRLVVKCYKHAIYVRCGTPRLKTLLTHQVVRASSTSAWSAGDGRVVYPFPSGHQQNTSSSRYGGGRRRTRKESLVEVEEMVLC